MATVLINDTVKKYLLRQSKDFRRKIRERFEFLEAGLWEGKLRAKKMRHISSKCVFEAAVDQKNRMLFTLGRGGEAGKSLAVYVWRVAAHDELSRRSKNIVPENVPFLSFHDYEEALLENVDMRELEPSCFTQEQITEKIRDESGSQRWYPVQEPEWRRIELFTKDDFELFLHLTPEQKDVLGSSLPLLVSGTAGSGKTTLSVYYLLNIQLNKQKKIFITYNRYLKNFALRLYQGLLNETEWRDEVVPPDFYVFKEFNLEIAAKHGKIFLPEKEVDFNRFSQMFAAHSMHDKFNSALVWEEIRSIIKGALPQVNRSILEKASCALRKGEVDPGLARKLQQQFILYSKLESLRAVDRFVSKYLKTDISTFSTQVEKYLWDERYRDRVLSIMDRTLDELEKHREAVDKKYLSFLEYELLGKKKAPNFQFNRKEIYHIFEWYQDRLERDHMWDELDLSREVLKTYAEKDLEDDIYDVLACDEVQDFTDIQVSLMFDMVKDPRHVFLAGDTKQTINPSGFRWEEVKRHFYERGLLVPELRSLTLNFRSSGSIVELANVLLELKEKYLGVKAEELKEDWKYKGRPVAVVSGIGEKEMLEIIGVAGAKRTLLVRNETEKERLKKILETELVFTMTEAKGLEFDTVVLWKFCDDQLVKDVWKVIADVSRRAVHEAKIRHEINLLYVGITRSRKDLIIYDGERPSFIWENQQLGSHVFITDDRNYLEGIWNVLSTPEEWTEQGRYFFEREYYRAAMECFKNGGDPELLSKASAYYYEKAGKYPHAAFHFEKIGESSRAAENYERAGEFRKALSLWEELKNEGRKAKCQIEVYKQEGRYREAAHLYLEKRDYQEAVEFFKKCSDYRMVAEIYLKRLKKVKEAASFFELAHDFEKSADLYNRLRSYDKAAELFYRGGNHLKAEALWKKAKNKKRLLDLYEKTGQVEKSLILYEKENNFEKAIKCLKAVKDKSSLGGEAEKLFYKRKFFQALVRYIALEDHLKTAECYLILKNYEEAIKYFKLAGDFYSAGNICCKVKDYKNALESYLHSEEDKKNNYSQAKRLIRLIPDDQWIYKRAQEFFSKGRYQQAAVLFSAFIDAYPELGTCYALTGDTEKALQAWKKARGAKQYERIAEACLSWNIINAGAKFFLSHQQKVLSDWKWSSSLNLKRSSLIKLIAIYCAASQNTDEMRIWSNFLSSLDFEYEMWEKVLDYSERAGDYNFLLEYFRRLKLLAKGQFNDVINRFRKDIPELLTSQSWEKLALRYFILDRRDDLNRIIPEIEINGRNYLFYLIGEKEHFDKALAWCLENNLLGEASEYLPLMRIGERAAVVYEKAGNLGKAADYYLYAGQFKKSALLYEELKRFSMAGDAYYKGGDFKNALRMYEKQTPPNRKKIAKVYERLEDFKRALEIWKVVGDRRSVERCLKKLDRAKQGELRFSPSAKTE